MSDSRSFSYASIIHHVDRHDVCAQMQMQKTRLVSGILVPYEHHKRITCAVSYGHARASTRDKAAQTNPARLPQVELHHSSSSVHWPDHLQFVEMYKQLNLHHHVSCSKYWICKFDTHPRSNNPSGCIACPQTRRLPCSSPHSDDAKLAAPADVPTVQPGDNAARDACQEIGQAYLYLCLLFCCFPL